MRESRIWLVIAILCVFIYACSDKSEILNERDNLIAYNDAVAEWIASPKFMKKLKKYVTRIDDLDGYLDAGMQKIAKRYGYKSIEETIALFKKYAEDPDVTAAMKKAEKRTAKSLRQLERYKVQLTRKRFNAFTKIVDADDIRIRRDMSRDDYQVLIESSKKEAEIEGISPDSIVGVIDCPGSISCNDSTVSDSLGKQKQ